MYSTLFGKYADWWVAIHAQQFVGDFFCANSRCDTLEAAAVSGGTDHRVSETPPRAAATTRETQTPTAEQYRITAEYWKPSSGLRTMYVEHTTISVFFTSAFLVESKKIHIGTTNHATSRNDKKQSCNRHNTSIQGRNNWVSRAIHGRMYYVLGGASPRRVTFESTQVRACLRPQFYKSVVH